MVQDYYNTLGLQKSASTEEIKKAYRKLAMQYHPDRNPDNPEAEAKFKEITQAYEILKDPQKKANYDRFGNPDGQPFGSGNYRTHHTGNFDHVFNDIGGIDEFLRQFHVHFGSGFGAHSRRAARNPDFMTEISISLEDAYFGRQVPFEIDMPTGETKKYTVDIPARINTGVRLKMSGKGSQQNTHLPPGDLYLNVAVKPHNIFRRMKADLFLNRDLTVVEAALGTEIEIQTISGRKLKIDIPAGTQTGQKIRLKGHGMPYLQNPKAKGDLYINVNVLTPTNLTERQVEILREFEKEKSH